MLEIGYATDAGIKRKNEGNQDTIGIVMPAIFNHHPPLFIIADGMGGYKEGQMASKIAVNTITNVYRKSKENQEPITILISCINSAHSAICSASHKNKALEKMGSTVAAVILQDRKLYLANVGDSRVYRINGNEIQQISQDQSFRSEFREATRYVRV